MLTNSYREKFIGQAFYATLNPARHTSMRERQRSFDSAGVQLSTAIQNAIEEIEKIESRRLHGRVTGVLGLMVEVAGLDGVLCIDGRCRLQARGRPPVVCEAVGFRKNNALLLPFGTLDGVGLGCKAELAATEPVVRPTEAWLGRVVNALGQPIDGKGPLPAGADAYRLRAAPPPAHARRRIAGKMDLGVRPSTPFLPAAAASAWESSPAPGSGSRFCCRCWRASPPPTST